MIKTIYGHTIKTLYRCSVCVREPHRFYTTLLERMILATPSTSRQGKSLFIACFPKSGSSYLSSLLARITGFCRTMLVEPRIHDKQNVNAGYHNEHDIDEIRIVQYRNVNKVIQQHAKGTENNVRILRECNIKPIVLVRNIYDVVQSLHDHFLHHSMKGPTGFVHKQFYDMTKDDKLLYIARVHTPWYFNFLISWKEALENIDILWVSYEELFADQAATVSRILDFQHLSVDTNKIEAGIASMDGANTLLNKGVSGRGQMLPDDCKKAILEIAECWKIDNETLAKVGIT